jgi:phenylacetate-CoA ligase
MRRIAKITGRSDDMLIIRGVNMFPSQIEEQILRCSALSPHYQIEVSRPERLDEVTINVEAKQGCGADEITSAASELRKHIKEVVGVSVQVNVCGSGCVARSLGKAVRVRDYRPK